jgi:hypothetical protein
MDRLVGRRVHRPRQGGIVLNSLPLLAAAALLAVLALPDALDGVIGVALGLDGVFGGDTDGIFAVPVPHRRVRRPERSLFARARHAIGHAWSRLPYALQPARLRNRARWAIGLYAGPDPLHLAPMDGVRNPILTRESVLDVDAGFVADPFLFHHEDRWYCFYEVLNEDTGLGEIAVSSSADMRSWSYEGIALVEPYHLSYPLVFEADGTPHLVVESSAARVVRAYRATDFPRRWEPAVDLLDDGPRHDPTLFAHDGRWWLFTGGRDERRKWGRLDLHVADHPLGPFEPHPASPVVENDPTVARPAGRVIRHEGRLIRFGQDCTSIYGREVSAAVIDCLTPNEYAETPLREHPILRGTGSGWNRSRMHHLDAHELPDGSWIAAVDGW